MATRYTPVDDRSRYSGFLSDFTLIGLKRWRALTLGAVVAVTAIASISWFVAIGGAPSEVTFMIILGQPAAWTVAILILVGSSRDGAVPRIVAVVGWALFALVVFVGGGVVTTTGGAIGVVQTIWVLVVLAAGIWRHLAPSVLQGAQRKRWAEEDPFLLELLDFRSAVVRTAKLGDRQRSALLATVPDRIERLRTLARHPQDDRSLNLVENGRWDDMRDPAASREARLNSPLVGDAAKRALRELSPQQLLDHDWMNAPQVVTDAVRWNRNWAVTPGL